MVSFQMGRVARPCQEHDPVKFTNCTVEKLRFRVPIRFLCAGCVSPNASDGKAVVHVPCLKNWAPCKSTVYVNVALATSKAIEVQLRGDGKGDRNPNQFLAKSRTNDQGAATSLGLDRHDQYFCQPVCPNFIQALDACVKVPTASQGQAVGLRYANIDPWSCKVYLPFAPSIRWVFVVTTCFLSTKEDGGFQRQVRGCHCAGTAYQEGPFAAHRETGN